MPAEKRKQSLKRAEEYLSVLKKLKSPQLVKPLSHVEALLEKDKLRPVFLFDAVRTRRVRPEEMLSADPQLRTLGQVEAFG